MKMRTGNGGLRCAPPTLHLLVSLTEDTKYLSLCAFAPLRELRRFAAGSENVKPLPMRFSPG